MASIPTQDWISVSPTPLSPAELIEWVTRADCGAVVTFCGTARNNSTSHDEVRALKYETSVKLAEKSIRELIDATRVRWPGLGSIAVHHRTGRVSLKETAVVVAVSAPHRQDAFAAAQFCIDTLKTSVPMWKREISEEGSSWSTDNHTITQVAKP
jgi:molybdopterin synthase catalytic subunit